MRACHDEDLILRDFRIGTGLPRGSVVLDERQDIRVGDCETRNQRCEHKPEDSDLLPVVYNLLSGG